MKYLIFDQNPAYAEHLYWRRAPGYSVEYCRMLYYRYMAPCLPEDPAEIKNFEFLGGACALPHRPYVLFRILPAGSDLLGRANHFIVACLEIDRKEVQSRHLAPLFQLPYFLNLARQAPTGRYDVPTEWETPFPSDLCPTGTPSEDLGPVLVSGPNTIQDILKKLVGLENGQGFHLCFSKVSELEEARGNIDPPSPSHREISDEFPESPRRLPETFTPGFHFHPNLWILVGLGTLFLVFALLLWILKH